MTTVSKVVGIYARVSKEDGRGAESASLEVQVQKCRKKAKEEGLEVGCVFKDDGISGSENQRPAYQQLLRELEEKRLDGVICYDTDRFTRSDDGELQRVISHLVYREQFLLDTRGYDSRQGAMAGLVAVMKAEMAAEELRKIRLRTADALRDRARRGLCAGGVPFGYTTRPTDDGFRELAVLGSEAAVVKKIFKLYTSDEWTDRSIAVHFNDTGVPTCSRRKIRAAWCNTTVRGILRNPVYRGELVWNYAKVKRAPGSSRKERHELPEDEQIRVHREDLRIVDEKTWKRVQARVRTTEHNTQRLRAAGKGPGGPPFRRLLSGLLICGECGGKYEFIDAHKYGCRNHRENGNTVCSNARRVRRILAEERILQSVKDELLTADTVKEMRRELRAYIQERKRQAREAARTGETAALSAQLERVERQIAHITDAIVNGGLRGSGAMADELKKKESERYSLQRRIDTITGEESGLDTLPDIPPASVVDGYRQRIERMQKMGDDGRVNPRDVLEARQWLRSYLGDIRLEPHRAGHLVAHITLRQQALELVAGEGGGGYWRPGQESNL